MADVSATSSAAAAASLKRESGCAAATDCLTCSSAAGGGAGGAGASMFAGNDLSQNPAPAAPHRGFGLAPRMSGGAATAATRMPERKTMATRDLWSA